MTTTTLQPITDSSVQIPEHYAFLYSGSVNKLTSNQVSNPFVQGITTIWQLTERQYNLWDSYEKVLNSDTNELTLVLSDVYKEQLGDDIYGERGNNLEVAQHQLEHFDMFLEHLSDTGHHTAAHEDHWVSRMRAYVNAKIVHALKDCLTEEEAAYILHKSKTEPNFSRNFGKDITKKVVELFIPASATTWDEIAIRGYTTPKTMQKHFQAILDQCMQYHPTADTTVREYIQNVLWVVEAGVGYPTLNPSLNVEIELEGSLISSNVTEHFSVSPTLFRWMKDGASLALGPTAEEYTIPDGETGTYQLQVEWTDALGDDHISYSNEVTI